MKVHFSLLTEETCIEQFDCKEEELNSFLKSLALLFQQRHFGVTIVCTKVKAKEIIGYYTLCPASIQREVLPDKFLSGPRPNPIPGFRLCRLAVDKHYQGRGWGKVLFIHTLKKCLDQSNQIGGNMIIIDAKHEKAKQFYQHFGFVSLPENELILVQTIKYIDRHFRQS